MRSSRTNEIDRGKRSHSRDRRSRRRSRSRSRDEMRYRRRSDRERNDDDYRRKRRRRSSSRDASRDRRKERSRRDENTGRDEVERPRDCQTRSGDYKESEEGKMIDKKKILSLKLLRARQKELNERLEAKQAKEEGKDEEKAESEDDDPLEMFMKTDVLGKAKIDIEKSKEIEEKERDLVASGVKLVDESLETEDTGKIMKRDELRMQVDMGKKCFICKKFGHSKGQCPEKRCHCCGEKYHVQADCPKWKAELMRRAEVDREKKRKKFYAKKKEIRKDERLDKLRIQTGVFGFQKLYRILQLPENKLADEREIKKAYQRLALIWHPDKHSGSDAHQKEVAAEKFQAIQDAYEILLEGLEKGNIEGIAVASGGTLNDIDKELFSFMQANSIAK